MPQAKRVPGYRLHRPSGQARVILDGKHVYLGPHGSQQSREAYARLIAERFSPTTGKEPVFQPGAFPHLTVNELLLRYVEFAERYYVKDGNPTKELTCMKEAIGPAALLYGSIPACEFGPLKLKSVREHMVDSGLSRGLINNRINRVKRVIKWAVSEELIPPSVYEGIRTVTGLRFGRTNARETAPIGPVADAWVDGILPYVSPQVKAMVELQRLTGMRPGEVIMMRPCDIDMTGEAWIYEPSSHKNRWRGHRRLVPLGPIARAIVAPFLARSTDAFLFSPQEADVWRNEQRALRRNPARKTKIYPSELRARRVRKEAARRRQSKRPKRDRYTTDTYRRAIEYGIKKANRERGRTDPSAPEIPHWHPHQLRHSFATKVRRQFGVEAAQVGLGHARTNVVEVYAQKSLELAIKVATLTG